MVYKKHIREYEFVTDNTIRLDDHRSDEVRRKIEMCRRPANNLVRPEAVSQPHLKSLEDQMLKETSQTWIEVLQKWRFLLDRYAKSPDASDARTQGLIKLAIADMAKIKNCREREP